MNKPGTNQSISFIIEFNVTLEFIVTMRIFLNEIIHFDGTRRRRRWNNENAFEEFVHQILILRLVEQVGDHLGS